MQPLIDAHELIGILERGLEGGLWSIAQFNAKAANPVLPRKEFLEETAKVPIASQVYRLRNLQRLFEKAQARGNMALAAALIEQAAKEVGGAYTNRREHSGPNGGPIPVKNENVTTLPDADLERIAAGGGP